MPCSAIIPGDTSAIRQNPGRTPEGRSACAWHWPACSRPRAATRTTRSLANAVGWWARSRAAALGRQRAVLALPRGSRGLWMTTVTAMVASPHRPVQADCGRAAPRGRRLEDATRWPSPPRAQRATRTSPGAPSRPSVRFVRLSARVERSIGGTADRATRLETTLRSDPAKDETNRGTRVLGTNHGIIRTAGTVLLQVHSTNCTVPRHEALCDPALVALRRAPSPLLSLYLFTPGVPTRAVPSTVCTIYYAYGRWYR